jgi:2-polyprenyl-3-methyl-5-hydroxy-6-metoxy-1,4-benzoquinol methylase
MSTSYDQIASQWIKHRTQLPPLDQTLFDAFIKQLPKHAHLLDLGCGSGFPIHKLMLDNGFSLLGIDSSKALLKHAQTHLPQGCFELQNLTDIKLTRTYQGIILWDALFHLPRHEHAPLLQKAFAALEPNGVMILSSGGSETDIPAFRDFMFDVEFHYDAHTITALKDLCTSIGFEIMQFEALNKPDGGRDKGRIGLLLRKP